MIKTILIYTFFGLILILFILWLINGGIGRTKDAASRISNPLDFFSGIFEGSNIRFPDVTSQINLPEVAGTGDGEPYSGSSDNSSTNPQENLNDYQNQYDDLNREAIDAQTFGTPSPYRGKVALRFTAAQAPDPHSQYVVVSASGSNASAVSISGWSLQSAVSGARATIPQAANPYMMGKINAVSSATLSPGAVAYIITGASPVGVSFHENICSGYMGRLVSFIPQITDTCPLPAQDFPATPENLRTYGDACFDYIHSLSTCQLPGNSMPTNLSASCRTYIANNFSYNGCVAAHRYESFFFNNSWYLYLSSATPLWRGGHDIIRLLDSEGRTVDAISY